MQKYFFLFFSSILFLTSCTSGNPPIPQDTSVPVTEDPRDAMMREHCKMMPEMMGCEKYVISSQSGGVSLNDMILTDDETVSDVQPTQVISLKDGDTYDLTIQKVRKVINGKSYIMLSYNGSIPGPTFRVPKGATIKFNVRNTVKELATTIHPHGIRLNYLYDGIPKDQGGVQDPIRVGDTYEQIVTFPDTGIFWYHPHTRDDFEQELGEYGTFQVYDPTENTSFDSENVITLDDILIENGKIPAFPENATNYALMGRYGNTMFVNGDTQFSLHMKQGEVKRLYLVNVANARPFDFAIPGVKMKLVGSDMSMYQQENFVDHVVIAPAERYIVDIMSDTAGSFPIESIGGGKKIALGTLIVDPSTTVSPYRESFLNPAPHDILGSLQSTLDLYRSKAPDKSITMTMSMGGMEGMEGIGIDTHTNSGIEWEDTMKMMNENSTNKTIKWILRDTATGKGGMDIDWSFTKGGLVKIRISNDGNSMHPMQHPFHMHGQRFLVLDQDGTPNTNIVWKDTVLIPAGHTVDILVDMDNAGTWMAHCHISEHIFAGMMFHYRVQE